MKAPTATSNTGKFHWLYQWCQRFNFPFLPLIPPISITALLIAGAFTLA